MCSLPQQHAGCFAATLNTTAGRRNLAGGIWQRSYLAEPSAPGLGLGRGLGVSVAPRQGELGPWGIPHPLPWDRALHHGCMWTPTRSPPRSGDLEEKGVNLGESTLAVPR